MSIIKVNDLKNLEIYKSNILKYKDKFDSNEYSPKISSKKFSSEFNGYELTVWIDIKTHIIDNASINECKKDIYSDSLMKVFCQILIGIPILEANDHAVMRLENKLRDEDSKPVEGIVMPENSCELFETPLRTIRDIYMQYKTEENYNPFANTYNPKEIKEWKELDISEREKIVSERISYFCKQHNIKEYKATLIGDVRVEFVSEKNDGLPKLLLDIETSIGKELGFSLEVMFTEKQDSNKKRKN